MNKKKMKKEDLTDYIERIKDLETNNEKLSADNKELIKLLSSKRYKAMTFLTDSAYRLIRKTTKKTSLLKRANENLNWKNTKNNKRIIKKGKVDIVNMNFYDWDGKVIYKGGAERYVYDLACLLKEMGYKVRLLQCSNVPFEKEYDGIKVVGIGAGDKSNMRVCSSIYDHYCNDAEFVIASPLELASEIKDIPVIGINHGVNFDGEWNFYDKRMPHSYDDHMDALKNVISCVCVDTNFINFTRTQDYALSLKERFIPNYFDKNSFKHIKERNNKKITFVYPRRLYNARGFDITVEAFKKILPEYKNKIILNFVGQPDNNEIRRVLNDFMNEYPENVFHYEYSMNEMPKAYESADVVLVPTRYSEGTSLSCIEGMASGAAIITTNVGGLPNLVIDNYNGLIISPTAEDLENAVIKMIKDPKARKRFAENGSVVAREAFTKDVWDASWQDEIKRVQKKLNS